MLKSRKRINIIFIGFITAILFALFLLALILFEPKTHIIPLTVKAAGGETAEEILPWHDGKETWYFFLPSYTDFNSSILYTHGRKCYLDGAELSSEQSLDFAEPEREYSFEQRSFRNGENAKIVFMKSANVPAMYINTISGSMHSIYSTKDYEESVSVRILDETGRINYADDYVDKLKGRGNSTWTDLEKKPFLLSLSNSASLLGMKKAVKWVLLANGYDETNLRNKLIFDFASKVDMGWTPHCEYVDLYLNGEYNGLYLLSEKVEVADNRLVLNDSDNDYLFESIMAIKLQKKDISFHISDDRYFRLNYSKGNDEKKLAEIQQSVSQLDKEINAGDLSGIDLDSWVKRFLIDEVFIGLDSIDVSSFYHFDTFSGKFYAGPIWDYDLAFGNDASLFTAKSKMPNQIWGLRKYWYAPLYQNKIFYEKIKQIYRQEFLPELEKMAAYDLPYQSERIFGASVCNSIRWDEMFRESCPFGDKELGEKINDMSLFMKERLSYLSSIWLSDKEFETVRWYEADKTTPLDVTLVEHGTAITVFPTQNDEMIYDWYDVNNGEAFDAAQPVTASLALYSKSIGVNFEELSPVSRLMGRLALHKALPLLSALCVMIVFSGIVLLYIDIRRNGKGGRHGK